MEEEQKTTRQGKSKGKNRNKGKDYVAKLEHTKTKWVLCPEDWRDIIITYVPQLNDIPIEDNYADMHMHMHMLSSFLNFVPKFCCNVPLIYI